MANNKENVVVDGMEGQSFAGKTGEKIDLEDIQDMINQLTEEMRTFERNGRYIDAQTALLKIEAFQKEANKRFREQVKSKHNQERKEIEEAHLAEFNQFEEFWNKKLQELEEETARVEQEMGARHQEELVKFEEELQRSIPHKPKDSSEVLNLKRIEESLAKQREYLEAHKVQQKCLSLESEETEKWLMAREAKIRNQLNQLLQKQQQEVNAIRKRITSSQDEQQKTRATELERLIQKYQNIKKELEVQQQMELVKLDKTIKNNGSVMRSSYGSKFIPRNNTSVLNQSKVGKV